MKLEEYQIYMKKVIEELQIKDEQQYDLFMSIHNEYLNILNKPKFPSYDDLENARSECTTKIAVYANSTDTETIKKLRLFNDKAYKAVSFKSKQKKN